MRGSRRQRGLARGGGEESIGLPRLMVDSLTSASHEISCAAAANGSGDAHDLVSDLEGARGRAPRVLMNGLALGGGSTMFKGFEPRLRRDVMSLLPESTNQYESSVEFLCSADPRNSAWVGGSIVAEFAAPGTSPEGWFLRSDFEEEGPGGVWEYCNN